MFQDAAGIGAALAAYFGLVLIACWVVMVVWTFRDMRARSRDTLAQVLMALMVALLTILGVLIYLFLRPRETLAEAYERSLEEEALLQEIEELDLPGLQAARERGMAGMSALPHPPGQAMHTLRAHAGTVVGYLPLLHHRNCPLRGRGHRNFTRSAPDHGCVVSASQRRTPAHTLGSPSRGRCASGGIRRWGRHLGPHCRPLSIRRRVKCIW